MGWFGELDGRDHASHVAGCCMHCQRTNARPIPTHPSSQAIFTASDDLRVRLPAECARYDAADADFRALMADAPATPVVVAATAVPGRGPRLEAVLRELEMCEKALQGYLEDKRLAFPRLYFVAPADLLDLLARGADPQAVQRWAGPRCVVGSQGRGRAPRRCQGGPRPISLQPPRQPHTRILYYSHLPKAFDAIHELEWAPSPDGAPSCTALAMRGADGERVAFASPCVCDGPVEVWLQRVDGAMRGALSAEYKSAVASYDDGPRVAWALGHSAQARGR